jgi:alkylhydroperoxidase/carboxymuconolactone decarboxylase family protein YurZ
LLQVQSALANHELTTEQLQEVVLQLAYYTGWGNATAVQQSVVAALATHTSMEKETREKK